MKLFHNIINVVEGQTRVEVTAMRQGKGMSKIGQTAEMDEN